MCPVIALWVINVSGLMGLSSRWWVWVMALNRIISIISHPKGAARTFRCTSMYNIHIRYPCPVFCRPSVRISEMDIEDLKVFEQRPENPCVTPTVRDALFVGSFDRAILRVKCIWSPALRWSFVTEHFGVELSVVSVLCPDANIWFVSLLVYTVVRWGASCLQPSICLPHGPLCGGQPGPSPEDICEGNTDSSDIPRYTASPHMHVRMSQSPEAYLGQWRVLVDGVRHVADEVAPACGLLLL